mmetsp:Transcript_72653/g.201475  ORF Transcript_72653/g.201475 Transcript_72653/m.201475 type:complete len:231 (-) Transcript_72653:834-1526(-)
MHWHARAPRRNPTRPRLHGLRPNASPRSLAPGTRTRGDSTRKPSGAVARETQTARTPRCIRTRSIPARTKGGPSPAAGNCEARMRRPRSALSRSARTLRRWRRATRPTRGPRPRCARTCCLGRCRDRCCECCCNHALARTRDGPSRSLAVGSRDARCRRPCSAPSRSARTPRRWRPATRPTHGQRPHSARTCCPGRCRERYCEHCCNHAVARTSDEPSPTPAAGSYEARP